MLEFQLANDDLGVRVMDLPKVTREDFAIHWPEPPHLKFKDARVDEEPCEIELRNGAKETGALLHFTGREPFFVFRPNRSRTSHNEKIMVKMANVRQMRLTRPVAMTPIDDAALGQSDAIFAPAEIQVYNVEFHDGEITSGETAGYVRLATGLFLFFQSDPGHLTRIFIPETSLAYCQIGDPIGKLLVEENVVSEEQLKVAVEKQQEMRRLVLGDYLIEQGYISPENLEEALAYQKIKPSLRLGEALIELGHLSADALQAALARQRANRGRPLGQILVDMGVLDSDTLKKVHAKKLGLPFVSLTNFKINPDALALVPAAVARRLSVVPLAIEDGALIVATSVQPDPSAISELGLLVRMRVVPVIASGDQITAKQAEFYGGESPASPIDDPSTIRFATPHSSGDDSSQSAFEQLVNQDQAIELVEDVPLESERLLLDVVNRMIAGALSGGELHLRIESEGTTRRTQIRFRKDRAH